MALKPPTDLQAKINVIAKNYVFSLKMDVTGAETVKSATKDVSSLSDATEEVSKVAKTSAKNINSFAKETNNADIALKSATKSGYSFGKMFGVALKKIILWAGATGLVYGALRQFQEGVQYVKDLNKELTNIQIVTGMTAKQAENLGLQYNKLAKSMGATTLEIVSGSLELLRAGKTQEETTILLKDSMMMSKLGNISAAEATELMIATMNGFKIKVNEVEGALSKIIAVDNAFSTSTKEVAEALKYSSAVANQAGVTYDQLVSYITTISSVMKISAETVGQSLRTVMSRFEQVKLGEMFEDDPTTINQVAESLHGVGIEIMKTKDEFRPLGDVIDELAAKWDKLTPRQQNAIGGTVAGKHQLAQFLTLMDNYDLALKAQEIQLTSNGLINQRYAVYLNSVEAAMNRSTAAWEKMWQTSMNSQDIKKFYDFLAGLATFIDKGGGLITVLYALLGVITLLKAAKIAEMFINIGSALKGAGKNALDLVKNLGAIGKISFASVIGSIGLLVTALSIAIVAWNTFHKTMVDTYNDFKENLKTTEDNISELNNLSKEYQTLSEKQVKTKEDIARLIDIQDILNIKYKAAVDNIDLKRAATEKDTKAIQEYINWMKQKAQVEADYFIQTNKMAYEKAKEFLYGKPYKKEPGFFPSPESYYKDEKGKTQVVETLDQYIESTRQLIALGNDLFGVNSNQLKSLLDQKKAAQDLEIEYNHYLNLYGMNQIDKTTADKKQNIAKETKLATDQNYKFSDSMNLIYKSLEGEGKQAFATLATGISKLGEEFEAGTISASTYFEMLNNKIKNLDLKNIFGDNTGAAQEFFKSIIVESADKFSKLNEQWRDGKLSIVEYSDQVIKASETMQTLGEELSNNAERLGMNGEELKSFKSQIESSSRVIETYQKQLGGLQQLNAYLFDVWHQLNSGTLKEGTEEFGKSMQTIADEAYNAAQSIGQKFSDMEGNVLSTSKDLYNYISGGLENFQNFSDQVAGKTGNAIGKISGGMGGFLQKFGEAIKNFKAEITVSPVVDPSKSVNLLGMTIPSFKIQIGGMEGLGQSLIDYGKELSAQQFNFDSSIYQIGNVAKGFDTLSDAAKRAEDAVEKTKKAIKEQEDAYQDLLRDTISMLKEKKEAEKEDLQEQLNGYKEIIDARKKLLDQNREEEKYQDKIAEKNKEISDIQSELLELQFDNSAEGKAKRLKLEESLAKSQKELADDQADHSVDKQKDALDEEYDDFKDAIDIKLKAIEDYLSATGEITAEAIALLSDKSAAFYSELLEWNRKFGTGVDQDIVGAWEKAFTAIEEYSAAAQNAVNQQIADQQRLRDEIAATKAAQNTSYYDPTLTAYVDNPEDNAPYDPYKHEDQSYFPETPNRHTKSAYGVENKGAKGIWNFYSGLYPKNGLYSSPYYPLDDITYEEWTNLPDYHSGGIAGDISSNFLNLKNNEIFAKLMKGEYISTPDQISKFINNLLPNIANSNNKTESIVVNAPITIQGNADDNAIDKLEKMIFNTVNKALKNNKGIVRNASVYGI
jgi:TP901 family phage tail tape measure protein